jgi:hypothetical protein
MTPKRPGHARQLLLQLAERLAITLTQGIEKGPPVRIRQGPEDLFHFHAADIR